MCLQLLMAGISVVGSLAKAAGDRSDAKIRGEIAQSNQEIAGTTAKTNRLLAELPMASARLEEARLRNQLKEVLGDQVAEFATAHIDPTSGAPLVLAGQTVGQAEVDAGLIRAQGELGRAQGLAGAASSDAEAATFAFQAAAAKNQEHAALISGILGAGTALLGGFSGGVGKLFGAGSMSPASAAPAVTVNPYGIGPAASRPWQFSFGGGPI